MPFVHQKGSRWDDGAEPRELQAGGLDVEDRGPPCREAVAMDSARRALLMSLHAEIAEQCEKALTDIEQDYAGVTYPPEQAATPTTGYFLDERRALQDLIARPQGRSALSKVIANAAGVVLFHLFTMIDGVADPVYPVDGVWFGMTFDRARGEGPSANDESMSHDDFFATYADYIEAQPEDQRR